MKSIEINGVEFEAIKPRNKVEPCRITYYDYKNIYEAYDNPSVTKVEIWNEWNLWQYMWLNYEVTDMHICSRNCFSFSIEANVWEKDTGEFVGMLHITRDHNRIYLA